MAWMFGGEAADRTQPDVKRLEISEGQFRTEGAAEIELPPLQGGARLSRPTRSSASGCDLLAASPPHPRFSCTPSERRGNLDSELRETLRTSKRSEY